MAVSSPFRPGRYLWPLLPAATVFLGAFLTLLPFGLVAGLVVTPAFALVPLYYWTTHRPGLLPAPSVFGLGVVQDLVTGGPLGLWAVVFLITYSVTLWQRGMIEGLPLRFAWPVFGLVTAVGLFGGWFAASVYHADFVSVMPAVIQTLTTAALFPVAVPILVFLEREIAAALRQ